MNDNVTLIPARKRTRSGISEEADKPKIRVAAYCRVSTDYDEQAGSYEAQLAHYTNFIKQNKEWELAGIYADEGISGTNTKKRDGFNEMISDCMDGKIDIVITKSISRFARNTLDCLKYVRQLKEKNIAIIFEKENINTLEASGELLLTNMASLAQQESQSMSQNIKMGYQFRFQSGQVIVNHNHFLGYTKDENGKLIIDEAEAKIVRRIYKEYLDGAAILEIAKGLERDNVMTGGKGYKWHKSTIEGILKNEKYIGDALLQKTITTDFIEKTRIDNDGSEPQYYVTGNHEPIIPRDVFAQVQEETYRRNNIFTKSGKKKLYSSRYALSSLCNCTRCGDVYRRMRLVNRGKESIKWKCRTRVEKGPSACDAPMILESELHEAVVRAINHVLKCSDDVKTKLKENIEEAIALENTKEFEAINKVLSEKQNELLKLAQSQKNYNKIADEIDNLKEEKKTLMMSRAQNEGLKRKITDLENFLQETSTELTEYDELMVRKYIREIDVFDDKFRFYFKAGVEVEINR